MDRTPQGNRGLDRRRVLLTGAGVAALAAVGGAGWIATRDQKTFVISLVRRALPGVTIDEPSARVFAADFLQEFYERFPEAQRHLRVVSGAKLSGAEAVREVLGTGAFTDGGPFESVASELMRRALTRFLMNSNFFQLADPTAEPIVYATPTSQACRSPFADLSPPRPEDVAPWRG